MIHAFTVYTDDFIYVIATDVWSLSHENMSWMLDDRFNANAMVPGIDLFDDDNVFRFNRGVDGEREAFRKVCEIYSAQL